MTREDIATERALKMHDLAVSVVRSKGVPRLHGSTTVLEYRYGLLTIHYRSGVGALDVWCVHKVLVVDRFAGKPQLIRYVPGLGNACSCKRLSGSVTGMRAGSINTRSNAIHALELYELALSLVQTKGALVPVGKETVLEYRAANLTIHYLPKSGHLDVWDRRKVLTIERYRGSPRVERYVPGYWEDDLEAALAKSRFKV